MGHVLVILFVASCLHVAAIATYSLVSQIRSYRAAYLHVAIIATSDKTGEACE